jgi:hypothetical protein
MVPSVESETKKEENKDMTEKTKRLNLRELLIKQEPIWVLNRTDRIAARKKVRKAGRMEIKKQPGVLVLQIGAGDAIDKLPIPPGRDPICLSDMAPYEDLLRCRDLFKAWNDRALDLLDPEKAEDYYLHNEGRREAVQKKIDDLKYGRHMDDEPMTPEDWDSSAQKEVHQSSRPLDPFIQTLCLKLKKGKLEAAEALEQLEERGTLNFSEDDLAYLQANGRKKAVKEWAAAQLMAIGEPEDEDEE